MNVKSCFILMPFTKANALEKRDLDYIYEHVIRKILADFQIDNEPYFQTVARFESNIGSIIEGIVKNLNEADLVIADLTGLNPNVMYELGVRHSLRRGTIIISQDLSQLPSDLRDYLTVGYTYSSSDTVQQLNNFQKFKNDLNTAITEIISTTKYDSPVLNYLQQQRRFRNEMEIDKIKEDFVIIKSIVYHINDLGDMINQVQIDNYESFEQKMIIFNLFNVALNNLSICVSELSISYSSHDLYQRLNNTRTVLGEINKMFNISEYLLGLGVDAIELFRVKSVKECIEKQFVNIFSIKNGLQFINMIDLFKIGGVIETEVLKPLQKQIEIKALELGIDEKELINFLQLK